MGYRLNCLDEPVFIAVPKPFLTEFGIHYRLESCEGVHFCRISPGKDLTSTLVQIRMFGVPNGLGECLVRRIA